MCQLIGSISNIAISYGSGKPLLTLEVNENVRTLHEMLDGLRTAERLTIKIDKETKKRSLDANAFYWQLIGKLSKALNISNPHCHNLMLRRYGVPEEIDGKIAFLVIPDTDDASKKADEAEEYHIKPTSQVKEGKDGLMYRTYILLKGSRSYTKEEFSRLLEGLVDECKQVGIETRCEEDVASMLGAWGK